MTSTARSATQQGLPKSPLGKVHKDYLASKLYKKVDFDEDGSLDLIVSFLQDATTQETHCRDMYKPSKVTSCTCLHDTKDMDLDERLKVAKYLLMFAQQSQEEQRKMVFEWMKYASARFGGAYNKRSYLLPGSTSLMICQHAMSLVLGWKKDAWKTIRKWMLTGVEPIHGLKGRKGNRNSKVREAIHDRLHLFFIEMEQLGCPRATEIVRNLDLADNSLSFDFRNSDTELVELPSCYSKRSIYNRFLLDCGWKYNVDSAGRVKEKVEVAGVEQVEVLSWPAFLGFWKKEYPHLVIARPREDICGDCWVFANKHKYLRSKKKVQVVQEAAGIYEEESEEDDNAWNQELEEDGGTATIDDAVEFQRVLESEELIMKASTHVQRAKNQRLYFNQKKKEAATDVSKPKDQRCYTFVADYAQNMYLPSFASEQPGETYYYSPLNCYCFGVVDCSTNPTHLAAYCYYEGEGKKGGNNVTSMLYAELKRKGITDGGAPVKEINFFFDNCSGQNKNRMVLRFIVCLVKMKICKTARAAFLIRGHTKNDCDRLFNLMKKEYRKCNVYNEEDFINAINSHKDVTAIAFNEFLDFDTFQEKSMRKIERVLTNHIFEVSDSNPNHMTVQNAIGEPTKTQEIVKDDYQGIDWNETVMDLQRIPPPGIQDIKWRELYDKWRPLIPEDKRSGLRYFTEDPGKERRQKVKEHTNKSKQQRKDRSRSDSLKNPAAATES